MLDKKKITKLIISIFLFVLGTLGSLFISSYLHLLLTKGLSEIKIFGLIQAIKISIFDKKSRSIFMILEIGTILLSVFYFLMKDNFYESELIEITPKIKIPKPAGQRQFGSARFMTNEEMNNLFTTCEVNNKDKLILDLVGFGVNEIKKNKKIIKEEGENIVTDDNEVTNLEIEENTNQESEIKNEKTKKVYRYKIQEEIDLLLEDDIDSLKYFNNTIGIIDEMICLEKHKRHKEMEAKIELMSEGDDKDKLTKQLEVFLNNTSEEIKDEIEKINNEELKDNLNKLLNKLYERFYEKQKEYIVKIESLLELEKEITIETDLNKYMNIAKEIEQRIDKLPSNDDKKNLFDKLFDFTDEIIEENNKRYEEIEKMLW